MLNHISRGKTYAEFPTVWQLWLMPHKVKEKTPEQESNF